MRGSEGQSKLTFTILGPKKNKNRHPAGGYYHETDPKKQDPDKGLNRRQRKDRRNNKFPLDHISA